MKYNPKPLEQDKQYTEVLQEVDYSQKSNSRHIDSKQRGASLVEYALLIGLIAIIVVVAMRVIPEKISQQFSNVSSAL